MGGNLVLALQSSTEAFNFEGNYYYAMICGNLSTQLQVKQDTNYRNESLHICGMEVVLWT